MMNEAEKTVSLSAKAIDQLPMPERIGRLRDAMLAEPRFVSIEQARIVTRVYQEHAGEPRILVRAQALAAALREMAIRVTPGELIVGNRTAGVRAGVVFPESGRRTASRFTRKTSASSATRFCRTGKGARSRMCCGAARAKRWTPSRAS